MIKNPEYLANSRFENTVKCIMAVVIPLYNGIIYTCLYIVSEPTGFYITLRCLDHPTYNKRQGKIFRCDAISQKLDDPEHSCAILARIFWVLA